MAFDFFTMASLDSFQYPHELFSDLLKHEKITPAVRNITETPDVIRTAYFETEDSYIIHQISMVPKRFHGDAFPVSGGTLELDRTISQAELVYPECATLEQHMENNKTVISLPAFSLQQIIVCKK